MTEEEKILEYWIEINYEYPIFPIDDSCLYEVILKGNEIQSNVSLGELKTFYNFELLTHYRQL